MRVIVLILAFVSVTADCAWAQTTPRRVVSVNITSDEILLALAPERVVALSVLADDPDVSGVPREAKQIAGRVKADSERIMSFDPDLVVIGGQSVDVAAQIERFGIRVIRIEGFESFAWIQALIRTLGDAVGARRRADALVGDMDRKLDGIRARVAPFRRPRVLTYSFQGGTQGLGTTTHDYIVAAGGENLAATLGVRGSKRLSLERLIVADPEILVMTASQRWAPGFQTGLVEHPALAPVRAVREGRVYQLPGRLMVTTSHHIVETVEALARQLHPAAFAESRR